MSGNKTSTPRDDSGLRAPSDRENALWRRLELDPNDRDAKEALIEEYMPIVKAELGRISYLLPKHVDRQELYADGLVGLLSALNNYDASKGITFVIYARKRVWGAMMDRVRTLDGVPRSARKAAQRLTKAINEYLNEHGQQPDESELAEYLKIDVNELHSLERKAALAQTLSIDTIAQNNHHNGPHTLGDQLTDPSNENMNPLERLAAAETRETLVLALRALPERERSILVLYYQQDMMLKEIAAAMEVSESRVSQLHTRALLRLRAFFEKADAASACEQIMMKGVDTRPTRPSGQMSPSA